MLKKALSATAAAGILLGLTVPISAVYASTPTNNKKVVTSAQTFPKMGPRKELLKESISTTTEGDWGGIEQLNIPQTKSQAEKDAEAKAAEEQAKREQQEQQSQQEVSRGATRQQLVEVPTTVSTTRQELVSYALQFQGIPYRYGGTTPAGWDCSGFTSYVYAHFGIALSHNSEAQRVGTEVSASQARPGDIMWKPGHVGIYLGNGLMVHASTPSTGTIVAPASYASFKYYSILD